MIECVECGSSHKEGTLFCEECGASLLQVQPGPTNVLPFSTASRRPTPPPLTDYELAPAAEPKPVTFVIAGRRQPIALDLVDEIVIGRADLEAEANPELDLTEYDGLEKGVSRIHASLQLTNRGIILTDLDSTNGTMLNNSALPPDKSYLVRTGDEIRVGDILFHIFFDL